MTSDRSRVSVVMPYRWSVSSSKRTVLKAVVRAPMAPTVKRFMRRVARQTRAK